MKKLIVFTDLDGTLLNHKSYDWKEASPAIKELDKLSYPLVFNSSKTSSEIKQLRKEIGNNHPFICENGALVYFNEKLHEDAITEMYAVYFSKPYSYILKTLKDIKKSHSFDLLGFNDMNLETLMSLTGLDKTSAISAKQREASEPLIWNSDQESLKVFQQLLEEHELTLTKGGRFYHVVSPINKGDSIKWLINQYRALEPETDWITVGLGDSHNDVSMFEQVDYPVLIKNPNTSKPDISHLVNIKESEENGPAGWNKEVLNIIHQITGNI